MAVLNCCKLQQGYTEGVVLIQDRVFFIDGPAGTGKSFLYNLLLAYVRAEEGMALASASCGLATLILKGGRTAHSRFKINIPPTEYCK